MKQFVKHILFICILITAVSQLEAADVVVGARLQEGEIYAGKTFELSIVIQNANQPANVDITPLKKFSPRNAGNNNYTSVTNGVVYQAYIMKYYLTVSQPGQVVIPSVTVNVDGKTYKTRPITVNVLKAQQTDQMHLDMSISESVCYVGQPIRMTLRWYIRQRANGYHCNVPVFNDTENYEFYDLDYSSRNRNSLLEFPVNSESKVALQSEATYQNKSYNLVTFEQIMIPKKTGTFTVPAAIMSANLGFENTRRRSVFDDRYIYKPFQATSQEVQLTVNPLPTEGQPDNFSGLIGRFGIKTMASPTEINVGDPITLTIMITGEFLDAVEIPELQVLSGFAENFKIPNEQSTPKTSNKQKVFTQTIRPIKNNVSQIPSIPISYFDVDKRQYVTVQSNPIRLNVATTELVSIDQAVGTQRIAEEKYELESIEQGIAANYNGPDIYNNDHFSVVATIKQPVYLVLWISPVFFLIVVIFNRLKTTNDPRKEAVKRQNKAWGVALGQLKKLKLSSVDSKSLTSLVDIMRGYIANRYNRTAESLTSSDCNKILTDHHVEKTIVQRFCQLLEIYDNARYGGMPNDLSDVPFDEIENLIKTIERSK